MNILQRIRGFKETGGFIEPLKDVQPPPKKDTEPKWVKEWNHKIEYAPVGQGLVYLGVEMIVSSSKKASRDFTIIGCRVHEFWEQGKVKADYVDSHGVIRTKTLPNKWVSDNF